MYNYKAINEAVQAYKARIAAINQVADVAQKFNVEPAVQQRLESKMQESSDFLGRINIIGVTPIKGEAIGVGVSGPNASRTDTTSAERETRALHALDSDQYECAQTNFDTHISYKLLDAWAHMPNFQPLVAAAILKRQALDRIMIGWNGTSVAATTNLSSNPKLQDVNKGWIQKLREGRPANVMSQVQSTGKIKIGAGVTAAEGYKNLDALVFDMVGGLDPWHQDSGDLVVICGRKILSDKYFTIVNQADKATEMVASDVLMSTRRMGGLPAVRVPHYPDNAITVTPLANLSIYYQKSARRRMLIDNPKRDRLENYESSNDAYVVEDFGAMVHAEKIEIVEG